MERSADLAVLFEHPEWQKPLFEAHLESRDGRLMFYDINANSNLRPSVAQSFGFDPFARVADYLARAIGEATRVRESAILP